MPSKFKSPYASAFASGIKSGKSCALIVNAIAEKVRKPATAVYQSLYSAGLCFRTKFNGTFVYWPTFGPRQANTSATNHTQAALWQSFVDWCLSTNCCTPWQLNNNSTSQKNFMDYCRTFFGRQFNSASASSNGSKSKSWKKSAKKSRKARKTTSTPKSWSKSHGKKRRPTSKKTTRRSTTSGWNWSKNTTTRNYKFPTLKARSSTRRWAKVA